MLYGRKSLTVSELRTGVVGRQGNSKVEDTRGCAGSSRNDHRGTLATGIKSTKPNPITRNVKASAGSWFQNSHAENPGRQAAVERRLLLTPPKPSPFTSP